MGTGGAADTCGKCGRAPAQFFCYEQILGKLVSMSESSVYLWMCRDCSRQVGRPMQSATLLGGWWGVRAFVRNLIAVVTNTHSLIRAALMPAPIGPAKAGPSEPSVFVRPQAWAAMVAIAAFAVWGIIESGNQRAESAGWTQIVHENSARPATPEPLWSSNHDQ